MDLLVLVFLLLGVLLILYFLGMPVSFAMGVTVLIIFVSPYGGDIRPQLISIRLFNSLNSFPMLAIPFYIYLGRLMNASDMTEEIFDLATEFVGRLKGGIAYVNVIASMIFSGMSGLGLADVAGLGRIEYAAMRKRGYSESMAIGVTGSSALIGPIIPPSVMMIIYGLLAEVSIGALFLAGIIPGLLLGGFIIIFTGFLIRITDTNIRQEHEGFSLRRFWKQFKLSLFAILIPFIIILGILSGFFTATEAGAVAVVYVIVGGLALGKLNLREIVNQLRFSMVETCALLFIVAMASVYGFVALELRVPFLFADVLGEITDSPVVLFAIIIIMFIVLGTFIEGLALMTIMVPLLVPILVLNDINLIHFGVVMTLAIQVGGLTPPLGVYLFVLEQVTDVPLEKIMKSIIPYYLPILATIFLCIYFSELVLWIPNTVL